MVTLEFSRMINIPYILNLKNTVLNGSMSRCGVVGWDVTRVGVFGRDDVLSILAALDSELYESEKNYEF